MEDHAQAEEPDRKCVAVALDHAHELVKRGAALRRLEQAVVDRHGLAGLAVARNEQGVRVDELAADGGAQLRAERTRKRRVMRQPHGGEHLFAFYAHIVHHHAVGELQRRARRRAVGEHHGQPVAQTDVHEPHVVAAAAHIFQIAQHHGGVVGDERRFAAVFPRHVGQVEHHGIPRRAVAPRKAPAPGGHDAGNGAVVALGTADVVEPFAPAAHRVKFQNHVLRRHGRIARPAVLFALGAVGGEPHKVGVVGAERILPQPVGAVVGARKCAQLGLVGMKDQRGEQVGRGLLGGDAAHIEVAEAVIHKLRLPHLFAAAGAVVDIALAVAVGEKARNVALVEAAVRGEHFARDDRHALAGLAVNFQAERAGIIEAEVIEPAALQRVGGLGGDEVHIGGRIVAGLLVGHARGRAHQHRLALRHHADGVGGVHAGQAARRVGRQRRAPVGIVKAGGIPAGLRAARIVEHAGAQVVEPNGRLGAAERRCVERHGFAAAHRFKRERKLGRARGGDLVKRPGAGHGVHHAVAEHHADHVFARVQVRREVVVVVINKVVGAGNVGREGAAGELLAVDEQVVEPQTGDAQLRRLGRGGQAEAAAEHRRRHMMLKRGAFAGGADKYVGKVHFYKFLL